jgi:hypothetical protein
MFNQTALKENPDPYQGGYPVIKLNHNDIPAFLNLQWKVWHALNQDEKHHLKLRTAEDLAEHLDAGMILLGVKAPNGDLIAQALLTNPMNPAAKNLEGYPFWGKQEDMLVVQSVASVQKGMAQKILRYAKMIAEQLEKNILLAKVADSNDKSQSSFLNAAFTKAGTGFDQVKGYPVTFFIHSRTASTQIMALNAKIA